MMRIGQGFDVHAFSEDPKRPLRLGGVTLPNERGLEGHSDADAVLHALADAFLGAAALGDIGDHFPDTDPQWKNADSAELLRHVTLLVRAAGYRLLNADITILAEQPKIAPYRMAMLESIADAMGVRLERVSLKATTTEKLGFVGRKEGIAVSAVVLLLKINAHLDYLNVD
ncbi:MAG: 2-C-methyl-D-erythritol 2,4-cyclodiphosphate synthase [Burkholderiales bacterium]|jgi:2-C-methyl-D-erythritol 2,4-cyclodiphosphate synthase|nr:2-C-methyl-D-erythritol 2,4-cyclodiphosphate synthase [Burkholderiales bacterium]